MGNHKKCLVIILSICSLGKTQEYQGIAHLEGSEINGTVTFTQTTFGLRVYGTLQGLSEGNYALHVHEIGDPSNGCLASGAHFNPDVLTHGGIDHVIRHVGDYGNIRFDADFTARIDFIDTVSTLTGRNSILGRTLVLHEGEDDLGLGGQPDSLTTGNAGGRVACGVIGLLSPVDPWNSATASGPALLLIIVSFFVFIGLDV